MRHTGTEQEREKKREGKSDRGRYQRLRDREMKDDVCTDRHRSSVCVCVCLGEAMDVTCRQGTICGRQRLILCEAEERGGRRGRC